MILTFDFLLSAFVALLALFILFIVIVFATSEATPSIVRYEEEKTFYSPECTQKLAKFPSLLDEWTLDLSVIVPAYNEEERLSKMLDECLGYLEKRKRTNPNFVYEVVIVDDGSRDKTSQVARKYTDSYSSEKVRVLQLAKNRGKGGAVRMGMLSSRGKYLLFADADGATKFSDLEKLEESLKDLEEKTDNLVVIGSRAHLEEDSIAKRSAFRTFLMFGFHCLVAMFGVRGIKDTQCGFKLTTRSAARLIYPALHVERWAFDVELLYIARKFHMPISEVAVCWTEIEGSKVVPVWTWLEMAKDLFLIWLKYCTGAWKISTATKL